MCVVSVYPPIDYHIMHIDTQSSGRTNSTIYVRVLVLWSNVLATMCILLWLYSRYNIIIHLYIIYIHVYTCSSLIYCTFGGPITRNCNNSLGLCCMKGRIYMDVTAKQKDN